MVSILRKIFGTKNDREIKRLIPLVDSVNRESEKVSGLTDSEIPLKTQWLRERFAKGETLDELLPYAFALTREASGRCLGMRHFDVQIMGGIVLHQGKISEMKTGEGKTLVATLALYLNALSGKGCHLVTVNDYLAKRDALWMGTLYKFLGLTVGVIQHDLSYLIEWDESDKEKPFATMLAPCERKESYEADIIYGTNSEFGFDYLRDNMKLSLDEYVQRELNYAIVDEVDSILIDEARTPLIISGPAEESTDKYEIIDKIIPHLVKGTETKHDDGHRETTGDFTVDEKARTSSLTEEGITKVEKLLHVDNLYDPGNIELVHHVDQALRAHALFTLDKDYVVKDGEVLIVDEFTGRLMPGRRYSDGLHQALEAKEGVKVERENQTLATITFQNYFRMYHKLSGMTGTADTEALEFKQIYNLDVVIIPTNRDMIRVDGTDLIYRTAEEKYSAIADEIIERQKTGQPILVGTTSVERSEFLSHRLKKHGVKHSVLNAKFHELEATIVADAGKKDQVTIATNMAGRGTDIVLGPGVRELGGLHIIATERHEARRIDNQLRGRSGRQGDPGSSIFYLSLEDDLLRIFGSERISGFMQRLGMEEGEPITHPWLSKSVENAQKKVEAHNFEIRKHLIDYDDVMNKQRQVIYGMRRTYLGSEDLSEEIVKFSQETIEMLVESFASPKVGAHNWDLEELHSQMSTIFDIAININPDTLAERIKEAGDLKEHLDSETQAKMASQETRLTTPHFREMIKYFLLTTLDTHWKEHLLNMDNLKEGIGLRGYGQKDPLREYQTEGYEMFLDMIERYKRDVLGKVMRVQLVNAGRMPTLEEIEEEEENNLNYNYAESEQKKQPVVKGRKVGRNDPCPCGSGKKYKKCCYPKYS